MAHRGLVWSIRPCPTPAHAEEGRYHYGRGHALLGHYNSRFAIKAVRTLPDQGRGRQELRCRWRIISGIQGKRTWVGATGTQKKMPSRSPIHASMSATGGSSLARWVGDSEADGKPAVEVIWGCWFGRRVWLGLVSSVELNAWDELARHRRQRSSGPWRPIRRTDTLEIRSGVRLLLSLYLRVVG